MAKIRVTNVILKIADRSARRAVAQTLHGITIS